LRGFRLSLASAVRARAAFSTPVASLFSIFSGGHASVLEAISLAGVGLGTVGCAWRRPLPVPIRRGRRWEWSIGGKANCGQDRL